MTQEPQRPFKFLDQRRNVREHRKSITVDTDYKFNHRTGVGIQIAPFYIRQLLDVVVLHCDFSIACKGFCIVMEHWVGVVTDVDDWSDLVRWVRKNFEMK